MAYLTSATALGALLVFLYYATQFYIEKSLTARNRCQPPPKRPIYDSVSGALYITQDARNAKEFRTFPENEAYFRRFGTTYREPSPLQTSLQTMSTENIQAIFGKGKEWGIQSHRLPGMRPFCGEGFLTTDGAVWEHSRALLQPSFHKDRIADLSSFEQSLNRCMLQIPRDGPTIDLQPLLSKLFIDTASEFLLGTPLGILSDTQPTARPVNGETFQNAFMLSLRGCAIRLGLGMFGCLLPRSMTSDHFKVVHKLVDYYIEEAFRQKSHPSVKRRTSLLNDLVDKTDDKVAIRNQVIQVMMASQDTTPTLVANSLFLLARNPTIWARLRAEVVSVSPQPLTLDDTRKIKLLQNVLMESLRLCPVFATFNRIALKHTILPTGGGPQKDQPIFVSAGTLVASDFYALHRDKSIYGPNAEAFDPDRWDHIQVSPFQHMGFGGGSRACLGKQKALAEASCVLIRFAQAFDRIESRDDKEWTGDQKLVAKNVYGCKVALISA